MKLTHLPCLLQHGERRQRFEPAIILLCAAAAHGLPGYVFFGSVDMVATLRNSYLSVLWPSEPPAIPYFPLLPVFFRAGAALDIASGLPVAFCYKAIPMLFGAFLALLTYEVLRAKSQAGAFAGGLLFALSPVGPLITSIHAQWDAICLFPLLLAFHVRENQSPGRSRQLLFGALFVCSIMVKPFPAALAPAFVEPFSRCRRDGVRPYLCRQAWSVLGAAISLAVFMAAFALVGYDLSGVARRVVDYAGKGVQIFGLPFLVPGSSVFTNRFWLLALVAILSIGYHRGRMDAFSFVGAAFLSMLGVAGLAPQYLLWPLPFLAAAGRPGLAALYTVVTSAFLTVYYLCPTASFFPWENMLAYDPLRSFAWLMPSAAWAQEQDLPLVLKALGNAAIPATSLGLVACLWRDAPGSAVDNSVSVEPRPLSSRSLAALLAPLMVVALAGLASQAPGVTPEALETVREAKVTRYVIAVNVGPSPKIIEGYPSSKESTAFNVVSILLIWTAIVSATAIPYARRRDGGINHGVAPQLDATRPAGGARHV